MTTVGHVESVVPELDELTVEGAVVAEPELPPVRGIAGVTPPSGRFGPATFLSDVILALGLADPDRVEAALQTARNPGESIEEVLIDTAVLSEEELAIALSERYNVDLLDLSVLAPDPRAQALLPPELARRYQAVPTRQLDDGTLLVAMANPSDWHATAQVSRVTGLEVRVAVAQRSAVLASIEAFEAASHPSGNPGAVPLADAAWASPRRATAKTEKELPAPRPAPSESTPSAKPAAGSAPTPASPLPPPGGAPRAGLAPQLEELRRWLLERWISEREARLEVERVQLERERAQLLDSDRRPALGPTEV